MAYPNRPAIAGLLIGPIHQRKAQWPCPLACFLAPFCFTITSKSARTLQDIYGKQRHEYFIVIDSLLPFL